MRTLNNDELYADLLDSISERLGDSGDAPPLDKWVLNPPVVLDGNPFSFERHEYLKTPYADDHVDVTFLKGTQLGLSSYAMLKAVWGARFLGYTGIMTLFPSRADALDFSKGRVNPLVDQNPDSIGKLIRSTDSMQLKQVWTAFWYFRGMRSRSGLKSVPIDFLIADELDEAPQTALDMAFERMAHSKFKHYLKLSNPTLPDYGISKAFDETDQRFWLLKCDKCNAYTNLVDTFPDCLIEVNGKVIRACSNCRAELDISKGEWVAKRPRVTDRRGYQFSQLFSHYVNPADILRQFLTTTNLQDFWNLKVGLGYVEAENRLSIAEVLALCGGDGILSEDTGPCYMGVDQGKDLHVVISKRIPSKAGKIVHIGVYRDWEELDRLMKNFHIARAVVDALPEMRNARAFAERHRGRAYLNYYSHHQKGRYQWNEEQLILKCNRTESLDASHREVMDRLLILPKECEIVKEFAKHLHNVAKKLETDEETGSKFYKYVKLGEDHFRHAFNYDCMARGYAAGSAFADSDLT